MIKKIILFVLTAFIAAPLFAQPIQYIGTPLRILENRGYFMSDSGNKAFTVGDTISATYVGAGDRIGDARLKSDIPYVRTSTQWIRLATGAGTDSTIYATKYSVDTMRTAVENRRRSVDTNSLVTNTPLSLVLDTVQRNGLNSAFWLSTIGALINTNALGVTQHDSTGLQLVNATQAAAGAQQISPGLRLHGHGYKTNAPAGSVNVDFQIDVLPVEGATAPTANLRFRSKIGAGVYADKFVVKSNAVNVSTESYGLNVGSGPAIVRTDASNIGLYYSSMGNGYLNMTSAGMSISYQNTAKTATSGTENLVTSTYTVSPASGTYTHRGFMTNPTINQTGGASGVTGSIYINPTLTAAADYRAIEITNSTGKAIVVSGTAPSTFAGNVTAANILSGTYTPTLTNTTNITSSTPRQCTYMRVGNMVTVSGQFDVRFTTGATPSVLEISIPIASNFTTVYQAGGTAESIALASEGGGIRANATTNIVELTMVNVTTTSRTMTFTFSYEIL